MIARSVAFPGGSGVGGDAGGALVVVAECPGDDGGAGGQGLEVVEQQVGHGLRHWGGRVAEPECDVLALAKDVVDCHADDPADRLGEQQDQTGGDPNSQRGAGVGEDPLQGGDSLVLAHRVGVGGRAVRDDQPRHPAAVHAPPQKCLCGPSGGVLLRVPGIEVGLGAGAQRDVAGGEPDQEGAGLRGLPAAFLRGAGAQRALGCFGAEFAELMPGGEVLKQLGVFGIRGGGDPLGEPPLEQQEAPVEVRQDTAVDAPPSLTGALLRTLLFDRWVADFLSAHPDATVVEIGTGLDTRHERVDHGRARWFDLDLSDVIGLRRNFFADGPRRTMIAASLADGAWAAEVASHATGPYLFVTAALLPYLNEPDVRGVIGLLADRFPGALLALDTAGPDFFDTQEQHDALSKVEARVHWYCPDPAQLTGWRPGTRVLVSHTLTSLPEDLVTQMPPSYQQMVSAIAAQRLPQAEGYRLKRPAPALTSAGTLRGRFRP